MAKCPKCESENIKDQGLTYTANQKNSPKYIHKCKDCGYIFRMDRKTKEKE